MRILNTKQFRAIIAALLIQQSFQRAVSFQLHQALLDWVRRTTGSDGSVLSVFGRVGNVVAVAGDYMASQITNNSGVAGADVRVALNALGAAITVLQNEFAAATLSFQQGQIYTHDGTATQALTAGGEAKMTLFTTNGMSTGGITPSADDDEIRITPIGDYLVLGQFSISSSTADTVFEFCAARNGTSQAQACSERKMFPANDAGSCSIVGFVQITEANQRISVNVTADKNCNLKLLQGQLVVFKITQV